MEPGAKVLNLIDRPLPVLEALEQLTGQRTGHFLCGSLTHRIGHSSSDLDVLTVDSARFAEPMEWMIFCGGVLVDVKGVSTSTYQVEQQLNLTNTQYGTVVKNGDLGLDARMVQRVLSATLISLDDDHTRPLVSATSELRSALRALAVTQCLEKSLEAAAYMISCGEKIDNSKRQLLIREVAMAATDARLNANGIHGVGRKSIFVLARDRGLLATDPYKLIVRLEDYSPRAAIDEVMAATGYPPISEVVGSCSFQTPSGLAANSQHVVLDDARLHGPASHPEPAIEQWIDQGIVAPSIGFDKISEWLN